MRTLALTVRLGLIVALVSGLSGCPDKAPTGPPREIDAQVFMLRFTIAHPEPNPIPDYKYCVLSVISDESLAISSASLTGNGNTTAFAYNNAQKKWWDDVGSRYCVQPTYPLLPVLPMNYTIFIQYVDGRKETLSRTVSSWTASP